MSKNKLPHRKSENVQIAKIGAFQAILVALITAIAAAVPAYYAGKQQGKGAAVVDGNPCAETRLEIGTDPQGRKENNNVIMIGSGTVYRYLNEHKILAGLSKDRRFNFLPMEGPTAAGVELFASASKENTVLVMTSRRYKIEELSRFSSITTVDKSRSNQTKEPQIMRPQAVFEVYLGYDPLQLALIAGSEANKVPPLKTYFENILNASESRNKEKYLDFEKLSDIENWWGSHAVYVGALSSATNPLWKELLTKKRGEAWPPDEYLHFWDIIFPEDVNDSKEPRIYLGSRVVNLGYFKMLKSDVFSKEVLDMYDNSNPVRRGLYLYGVIDKGERDMFDNQSGYKLPNHVKKTLKYVLSSLKDSPLKLVENACLQNQIDYFHLNSDVGWVIADNNKRVFGASDCKDQPGK